MKKILSWIKKCILLVCVLLIAGAVAFKIFLPTEKIKSIVLTYAEKSLNREISFDDISLNVLGVTLSNFAMSEDTTFKEGTFIKADKLVAKIALLPLFHKSVEVSTLKLDGLEINITKKENGSFNFETLTQQTGKSLDDAEKNEDASSQNAQAINIPLSISAKRISITNGDFNYYDKQSNLKTSVNDLNISIENFSLDELFSTQIDFVTHIDQENSPSVAVPVSFNLGVNLSNLKLEDVLVNISNIEATYKDLKVSLSGSIKGLVTPEVAITGSITGISNALLVDFLPEIPEFSVPKITLSLKLLADINNSQAQLEQLAFNLNNNSLLTSGSLGWKDAVVYNLNSKFSIDLAEILQMTSQLKDFSPQGTISGTVKATEKNDYQDISGNISLKDLSVMYDSIILKSINAVVKIVSLSNISCDSLKGELNNNKFSSSFSYKNLKDVMNVVFNLDMDALILDKLPNSSDQEASENSNEESGSASGINQTTAKDTFMMNLTTNVQIGKIQVPYFTSDGFSAVSTLTGITSSMSKMNGNASFTLKNGSITDVDAFIKSNKIGKILLIPVTVVSKVSKALNVEIFSQNDASIPFNGAEGVYTFTNGLITLNKTTFDSKLATVNASGNINLVDSALNMKANATLFNGNAPIALKIGGTIDNPSGKLDVVNTVTSVIDNVLGNSSNQQVSAATSSAKEAISSVKEIGSSAIKSIGGLFKSKK